MTSNLWVLMVLMLAGLGAPVGSEVVAAATAAAVTPGVGMIGFELVNDSGYTLWNMARGTGSAGPAAERHDND